MFDEEDNKEFNQEEESQQPIDGQIGIEDLYLPEIYVEDDDFEDGYSEPIDGQLSFSDFEQPKTEYQDVNEEETVNEYLLEENDTEFNQYEDEKISDEEDLQHDIDDEYIYAEDEGKNSLFYEINSQQQNDDFDITKEKEGLQIFDEELQNSDQEKIEGFVDEDVENQQETLFIEENTYNESSDEVAEENFNTDETGEEETLNTASGLEEEEEVENEEKTDSEAIYGEKQGIDFFKEEKNEEIYMQDTDEGVEEKEEEDEIDALLKHSVDYLDKVDGGGYDEEEEEVEDDSENLIPVVDIKQPKVRKIKSAFKRNDDNQKDYMQHENEGYDINNFERKSIVENKDEELKDVQNENMVEDEHEGVVTIATADDEEHQEKIEEKVISAESGHDVVDGMLYKNLDEVLHESMIPYSEHVILDRALPRVEDGLKPVQRRILYSMLELGITPDKPYRKSARIVGDCLGKYHPHGDSSVYFAMVRMAQPFNMRELLVNGHGNFGSIDGDSAAAMRYTEARLAPLAMELLRDLDKDTVKWNLNFDDSLKEPDVLPGRFPNLLVNGATGIAVGLATNIPPHNLAEVIDGVVAYIDNNNIQLKDMMKIIKGPDFPTGGYILSNSELEKAYSTGKGRVFMRAKMHIETNGGDKRSIVITEIPYQTNKVLVMQKIATLREDGKNCLVGISEIRDESDRNGLRVVIRVKKDADIKQICEFLLKNTDLQCTFGINMVAIAGGKPKQMGLMDIISYYVEYQREVVYKRTKYDLDQAKEREHILTGLIIAIKNIDAVVKIIKTSPNTTTAKQRLREKFILSERQAQAILDMRLARLTSLEVNKLEEELKALRELIKKLSEILGSKKLQFNVVRTELMDIKRRYKNERQTVILKQDGITLKIPTDDGEKEEKQIFVARNALGNLKAINAKYASGQHEFKENSSLAEVHNIMIKTDTNKTVMFFTNIGNCFKVSAGQIPESRFKDKGVAENVVIKQLAKGEKIVAAFAVDKELPKQNLIFLTKYGMIKKTEFGEYGLLKTAFQAMKLKDDDEIINIVLESDKEYSVLFVTNGGMLLKAENTDIPLQGRISGGVKGINLSDKDFVVGAMLVKEEGEVVVVTDSGFAKRMVISGIDKMARYRKGVKAITFTPDNGKEIVFADYVTTDFTIVAKDNDGELHTRSTELVPIETRLGKGKNIDRLKKTQKLVEVYRFNG